MTDHIYLVDDEGHTIIDLLTYQSKRAIISFTLKKALNTPSPILTMRCSAKALRVQSAALGYTVPQLQQNIWVIINDVTQFTGFITNITNEVGIVNIECMSPGILIANYKLGLENTRSMANLISTVPEEMRNILLSIVGPNNTHPFSTTQLNATSTTPCAETVRKAHERYVKYDGQTASDVLNILSMASIGRTSQIQSVYIWHPLCFGEFPGEMRVVNRGSGYNDSTTVASLSYGDRSIVSAIEVIEGTADDIYNDVLVTTAVGDYNTTTTTPDLTATSISTYGMRTKKIACQMFYDCGPKEIDDVMYYGMGVQLAEGILSFSMTPTTTLKLSVRHEAATANGPSVLNQTYNITNSLNKDTSKQQYNGFVCVKQTLNWPSMIDELELTNQGLGSLIWESTNSEFSARVEQLERYSSSRNLITKAFSDGLQYFTAYSGNAHGPNEWLLCKNEQLDYGGAYDSNTGTYVATVSGIYHIEAKITIVASTANAAYASLIVSSDGLFMRLDNSTSPIGSFCLDTWGIASYYKTHLISNSIVSAESKSVGDNRYDLTLNINTDIQLNAGDQVRVGIAALGDGILGSDDA